MRLIRDSEAALRSARDAVESSVLTYGFDQVRGRAPLPRPGKILCSGVNYRGHLQENPAATLPEAPFFFAKLPSGVIAPGESIVLPRASAQVDYEVELAVVTALARGMTLEPGDIVSTGTPAGVGYFRRPQRFLRPGDTRVLEIDGIGRLENPVMAEAGGS
jgi:2-keto-4-pentenoate hydratase/2-oxohepta-3-ene-1,7-dioic acid hydratase in catechol pathway